MSRFLLPCFHCSCQESRCDTKDPSQLWSVDKKILRNQADVFKSDFQWRLKKQAKNIYCVQNISNKTVLEVSPNGQVSEEDFVQDKPSQLWRKGKINLEGYFTLENPESRWRYPEKDKFLCANSENDLHVSELIEHPKCSGRASLYNSTNKMVMKHPHNHPTREKKIRVMSLKQLIYRGAGEVSDLTLHQIFVDITIEEEYDDICYMLNFKSMEPGMRSRRKRNFPCIPHSIEEVHELMDGASLDLSKYYQGVVSIKG